VAGEPGRVIRWVWVVVVGETLLAAVGAIYSPAALAGGGWLALAGVAVAQALCALLIQWGPLSAARAPSISMRTGVTTGAVTGVLYGAEGLAEYVSPAVTDRSVAIGWVIVAGIVGSNVVAATVVTLRTRSTRAGVVAAVYNAVTEYLVWYPSVLLGYYVFRNSGSIGRVWQAEGTYTDFARSGMTDIHAFVVQDDWGAGFFHLLAGLVFAAVFGGLAALAVRGYQRLPRSRTTVSTGDG
jgi:hypothetical protein